MSLWLTTRLSSVSQLCQLEIRRLIIALNPAQKSLKAIEVFFEEILLWYHYLP
jgi:hypothetical protein